MVITPDHEELFRIICDNAARAAPALLYTNIASSQENIIRISNPYARQKNEALIYF